MKREKVGFIYIWYDRKRKMYYIGSHWGTEDDGYICSSKIMMNAYRKRQNDFKRKILKTDISSRKELLKEEDIILRSRQTKKEKYYNVRFCVSVYDNLNVIRRKHTEKSKEKMSVSAKNRNVKSYKNRMNVRHKITGWQGKIDCKDYNKEIHESLVFRSDKKVTVIDEFGNSFGVTKKEFMKNKDKLKTHSSVHNKGKVVVVDSDGNRFSVYTDDQRIGDELKVATGFATSTKGTVPVYTPEGKCIRVPKDHPKILSGEYIFQCGTINKGRIIINNGKINKKIYPEDLPKYEGWVRGMLRKKSKSIVIGE